MAKLEKPVLVELLATAVDGDHCVSLAAISLNFELVGSASIVFADSDTPTLGNLFVLEGRRREGIASGLTNAALSWANSMEKSLYLHVQPTNTAARALYQELGFEYTGELTDSGSYWMVKSAFECRLANPWTPPLLGEEARNA
ncbi:GNAT family N-acetyltransferase [Hymenobacter algoricola]|uniref:N-acetyltransferase domain-containing protein n=1 Tax=Hymenobacter algoricola TaxID=486267 RepID=A0ABP7NTG4_9BACT